MARQILVESGPDDVERLDFAGEVARDRKLAARHGRPDVQLQADPIARRNRLPDVVLRQNVDGTLKRKLPYSHPPKNLIQTYSILLDNGGVQLLRQVRSLPSATVQSAQVSAQRVSVDGNKTATFRGANYVLEVLEAHEEVLLGDGVVLAVEVQGCQLVDDLGVEFFLGYGAGDGPIVDDVGVVFGGDAEAGGGREGRHGVPAEGLGQEGDAAGDVFRQTDRGVFHRRHFHVSVTTNVSQAANT